MVLFDRYMCVSKHSAVLCRSISVLIRLIFLPDCCEKRYSKLFIFLWPDSLHTRLQLMSCMKIFPTIYCMPGSVSIYLLTTSNYIPTDETTLVKLVMVSFIMATLQIYQKSQLWKSLEHTHLHLQWLTVCNKMLIWGGYLLVVLY